MAKGKKKARLLALCDMVGSNDKEREQESSQEMNGHVFVDARSSRAQHRETRRNIVPSEQDQLFQDRETQRNVANTQMGHQENNLPGHRTRNGINPLQPVTSRSDLQHSTGLLKHQQQPTQKKELVNNLKHQQQRATSGLQLPSFRSREDPLLDSEIDSSESGEQSDSDGSKTKKGRGPAEFPDEWDSGRRLNVTLNAQGQIVGEQYQEFATAVGCMAKVGASFPITCKSWNAVCVEKKEEAWKEIEEKTFIPEEGRPIVLQMLNACWKTWKYRVKKHYRKYQHNEQKMYAKLDKRVVEEQFQAAILYWKTPAVEDQATTNATNRNKKRFPHRTGRTSFSELSEELAALGYSATQLDIWLMSRSHQGKEVPKDHETTNLFEYLMQTVKSVPKEERTTEFREKLFNESIRNDKSGQDICIGKSIRKRFRGSSSSRFMDGIIERDQLREQIEKLKHENEEVNQSMKEMMLQRQQEKEIWDQKFNQLNDLIASYGPPQSSSKFASCSANMPSQEHHDSSIDRLGLERMSPETEIVPSGGISVLLYCMGIPKVVVADGVLVSKDPDEKVDNVPLGRDDWKIFVENVNFPNYEFCRSGSKKILKLGRLVGKCVAWPKSNVVDSQSMAGDVATST